MNAQRKAKLKTTADILAFILKNKGTSISQRKIGETTGYSASTVYRSLVSLEQLGVIEFNKEVQNKPTSIKYIGSKNIKRSVITSIYDSIDIIYDLLIDIMENKSNIEFKDLDSDLDPSMFEILIRKELPENKTELIVLRRKQ